MDRVKFFAALRRRGSGVFGTRLGQQQVDGINGILAAFAEVGDGRDDTLAYALATAYHETGARMVPVREGFATTDAGARRAVNALAKRRGPNSAVAKYAKPQPPYGHVYYGRGHVQLTWLDNYRRSSADAGVDLVKSPDAMLDPKVSARVLFHGLLDGRWNGSGKGLRFYLDRGDVVQARRTVNILDKASLIAGYHRAFLTAITTAGGWRAISPPLPQPKPATYTVRPGDTLGFIAGRHGVSWQDIAALNGIVPPYTIYPGDELRIPGAQAPVQPLQPPPPPPFVLDPPRPPAPKPEPVRGGLFAWLAWLFGGRG